MTRNSITAWQTNKPLLLIHGEKDTHVSPLSTENMYSAMIKAGTSSDLCEKVIIPGVGHEDGAFPAMIKAIKYLENRGRGSGTREQEMEKMERNK